MQASTKYSPFEMLYNRAAILPCHNQYINPPLIDPQMYQHADQLSDELSHQAAKYDDIYDRASMNLQRDQDKQSLDWRRRHITAHGREDPQGLQPPPGSSKRHSKTLWTQASGHLQSGDLVLIKNPQKTKKMDPDSWDHLKL